MSSTAIPDYPNPRRPCVLFLPCYRDQRMLDGVCKLAAEAGWILDTLWYHTGELPYAWDGDGILCMLQVPLEERLLSRFVREHAHMPVVDLSWNDKNFDLPRVLQDNHAIGRLGAEHLVARGCHQLGFLMHTRNSFHEERFEGFCAAAASLGHEARLIDPPGNHVRSRSRPDWLTRHIGDADRPFGLMAAADYLTQWVIQACHSAGLSIPEDIALLGVDNCREICELSSVGISSIDNNAFLHGYEGAKLLNQLICGHPPPATPLRVPPGPLYVRDSTDILATRHPQVASALHCISENFTNSRLTPKSVAEQVPMSERRLHDAFLKFVGRSIYQEIVHRRLQLALQLIQTSDRKLWDVADAAGFSSPELMSRLFRRQLGSPPSSFRPRNSSTPCPVNGRPA